MTKENLEIYQEVFPKSQLRRMKVVDEYLNTFGEMIKKKVISPNCAFEALAKKYELTRAGIRVMLTKAGVYKSSQEPLYYPTAEADVCHLESAFLLLGFELEDAEGVLWLLAVVLHTDDEGKLLGGNLVRAFRSLYSEVSFSSVKKGSSWNWNQGESRRLCLVFSSFFLEKRCGAVSVNDSYLSFILWFCNVLSKS